MALPEQPGSPGDGVDSSIVDQTPYPPLHRGGWRAETGACERRLRSALANLNGPVTV